MHAPRQGGRFSERCGWNPKFSLDEGSQCFCVSASRSVSDEARGLYCLDKLYRPLKVGVIC